MIVRESISHFQRGKTDQQIKDLLFGWKEGQLLVNPYTDIVYVYIDGEEDDIRCFGVGHIGRKRTSSNPKAHTYFSLYKKNDVNLNSVWKTKDKVRPLNDVEINLVKPTITSEYIEKVRDKFGITIHFR